MAIFIPRKKEFWQRKPTTNQSLNEGHELAQGITRAYGVFTDEGGTLLDITQRRHADILSGAYYTTNSQGVAVRTGSSPIDLGNEPYHNGNLSIVIGATVNGGVGDVRQILSADSYSYGDREFQFRVNETAKLQFISFTSSGIVTATSSYAAVTNTRNILGATYNNNRSGDNVRVFLNGQLGGQEANTGSLRAEGAYLTLGAANYRSIDDPSYQQKADVTYDFIWIYGDKPLGDEEHQAISEAPYQILKPKKTYFQLGSVAAPTATLSGSATASITEVDIAAGGKQIILDLTNDTWVAAGTAFDAIRQDILDGLVSAQNEQFGWNNIVSPNEPVTSVVRDSDTRVIITLEAH